MAQKLDFAAETYAAINLLSRDYGLMRVVPERSATPYPRASQAIDAVTLRNRLAYQGNRKANEPESNDDEHATVQNKRYPTYNASVDLSETFDLKGPHPLQCLTVDFKQVANSIESKKQPSLKVPQRQTTLPQKRLSLSARSSYNQHLLSIGTPHPSKKIALNPKVLLNRLSAFDKEKKVKILIPADSSTFRDNNSSLQDFTTSVESQSTVNFNKDTQSFYERRKVFDMNEFNIAKNGKKLSEMPMYEKDYPLNDDYLSDISDVKDVNDMKKYLKKYGFKMSKRNTFSDLHGRFRNLSFDSQSTPPTSITEETTQL